MQPVKVKSTEREKVKDISAFPHWVVLSRCSLHFSLFVKIARKFTMMTKRPAEEKLGINQRELSVSFGKLWAGKCQRTVQHDIHSFHLALRPCWVSKAAPCRNAVMFLSCTCSPLQDAFGLSVVVLYLLILFHQTWIVKLAWRGLFYYWTLKEARKSSFWTEWACSILTALSCFEGCFLMLRCLQVRILHSSSGRIYRIWESL